MARIRTAYSVEESRSIAQRTGISLCYPSGFYTMGGTGGGLIYNEED